MSSATSRRPASRCSSTKRAKASSRPRSAAPPRRLPCSAPPSSAAPCRKVRLPRRQVRRHPLADARPRVAPRPPPRAAGFIPRSTSVVAACRATLLPSSRRRSSPRSPSCSTRSRSTHSPASCCASPESVTAAPWARGRSSPSSTASLRSRLPPLSTSSFAHASSMARSSTSRVRGTLCCTRRSSLCRTTAASVLRASPRRRSGCCC